MHPLRKLRGADLDNEEVMSKTKIVLLLMVFGLPRLCDSEGGKQVVFEERPGYHEATDFLVGHGLNIGRKNSGRHGLPLRIGPRLADPSRAGALRVKDHVCLSGTARAARRRVMFRTGIIWFMKATICTNRAESAMTQGLPYDSPK